MACPIRRPWAESESSPGRILDCDKIFIPSSFLEVSGSESSPGRILDCDSTPSATSSRSQLCLNHLQGEYWIATCVISMVAPSVGTSLNHLQGEYWIATHQAGQLLRPLVKAQSESSPGRILDCDSTPADQDLPPLVAQSESSPGRILDCDIPESRGLPDGRYSRLNHLQGEYWIATFSSIILCAERTAVGLNHLQGEYWIATLLSLLVLCVVFFCLNHLQGEYWIATF